MNNPDWMMFYRERDGIMFLFNGKWALRVNPAGDLWATDFLTEGKTAAEVTEEKIDQLKAALNSSKRIFTIEKIRYRILERGNFIIL